MHFIGFVIVVAALFWAWPFFFAPPPVIPETSALGRLSNVDQAYYRQVFDYTMENIPADGSYGWKSATGEGNISVSAVFTSKSSATCRNFSETYTVGGVSGRETGVACRRDDGKSWCRLKKTDVQTCALESPANLVDGSQRGAHDLIESAKNILGKITGWMR